MVFKLLNKPTKNDGEEKKNKFNHKSIAYANEIVLNKLTTFLNNLSSWPNQTRFLRSLISSQKIKFGPNNWRKKKRIYLYTYHFIDEKGSLTCV